MKSSAHSKFDALAIIACGLAIMFACFGIGGCMMLGQSKIELKCDSAQVQPLNKK
jgi:hypothetical protein